MKQSTLSNFLWHGCIIIAAIGFAAMLTRYFWFTTTTGKDLSFGGIAIMLVAMIIFIFSSSIIHFILALAGRQFGNYGRLVLVIISLMALYIGLYRPIHDKADFAKAEKRLFDLSIYESKLAASRIAMKNTPHAPAGVVPDILKLEYHDNKNIAVTNLYNDYLEISLRRVLPQDYGWERCWLGTKTRHGFTMHSRLSPGDTKIFINNNCDKRFDQAPLEFQVSTWDIDKNTSKILFKSDSAFAPDYPQQ